ncbi:membrane DNA delivery protein [Microbacterium phage LuzDeMundo]|nr:membrane DNA delivery protein [Microbacterium phage MuffinTheCat]QWY84672.1 membrane DNA delivery protein [Microbacterium phage Badulia]UJQ86510.1 membrane DNA delivery protein [Microbacterium phage DesireeRose]UVG34195.1 membrane DNA delivery protein [Microbacterium phage LuzDeMundo]WGH20699.1 membrane DNA delivery [Microbacterium phage SCoupsA]WGH21162.1 membrane DNA delivery [Microbacterium phage Bee17]
MIDKIISVFVMALVITGLGIAVRPGSQAPALAEKILSGFAGIQRAAYGN